MIEKSHRMTSHYGHIWSGGHQSAVAPDAGAGSSAMQKDGYWYGDGRFRERQLLLAGKAWSEAANEEAGAAVRELVSGSIYNKVEKNGPMRL